MMAAEWGICSEMKQGQVDVLCCTYVDTVAKFVMGYGLSFYSRQCLTQPLSHSISCHMFHLTLLTLLAYQHLCTHVLRVLIEASSNELFEGSRVVPCQFWRVVLWDKEEHTHWVEIGMRGLPLCQLNRCDAK